MECPDCGEPYVSREVGPGRPPSTPLANAILDTEQGEEVILHRQCWTCGWSEDRHIEVAAIETEHGDPEIVDRQQRLSELVGLLEGTEDTETLESVLQYVRQHQSEGGSVPPSLEEDP
ncbi:hypothetical protein [Haloferax sp. Atlit-48N]|uniref:Uncharacterized protein n=1 Tax=Haloferax sp. Atlit-48N TaxID=2077198 RepID=A0ACD5HZV5_9EURY|nr:hypothetical protein [Haloferax sp. Atlit-48N]RDZ30360.1 hypothetical protein DEQ67_15015 [Haloferax sp. Atlit-48N]